jgi:dolichyl-phosphate beta-glucosyltransferase
MLEARGEYRFIYKAAEDLFGVSRINGIGFDIELIYLAQKRGYKILEVPINWYYNDDTRMRVVEDSLAIFKEILQIRRNWREGLYKRRASIEADSQPSVT